MRQAHIFIFASFMAGICAPDATAMEAHRAEKAGRPLPNPESSHRTVPELVCTGTHLRKVIHTSLETQLQESPLRLRLRGNVLYIGQSVSTEKFAGLINKSDKFRWVSGHATLVLNESLDSGVWITAENDMTTTHVLHCEPFDTSRR